MKQSVRCKGKVFWTFLECKVFMVNGFIFDAVLASVLRAPLDSSHTKTRHEIVNSSYPKLPMATHSYLVEYADWRKPCITLIWYLDGTSTQLTIRLTLLLRSWDELQGHDKFLPSQPSLLPVRDVPNSLQDLACSDRATKEQVVQCQIMSNHVKSCHMIILLKGSLMAANKLDGLQIPASRGSCDLERKSKAASPVRPTLVQHSPTWLILFSSVQFCSVLFGSDQFWSVQLALFSSESVDQHAPSLGECLPEHMLIARGQCST